MANQCGEFGAVSADDFSGAPEDMSSTVYRDFRLVLYERIFRSRTTKKLMGPGPLPSYVVTPEQKACEDCEAELLDGGADTFDCYTDAWPIILPIGCGLGWSSVLASRTNFTGIQGVDFMEQYSNSSNLHGLSGGAGWGSSHVDRQNYTGLRGHDSLESYSDGAAVNGLNGGTGFSGGFIDRDN